SGVQGCGVESLRKGLKTGLSGALWDGLDERKFAKGHAGFQKPVTIVGDVSAGFPGEISEMPFNGQPWKVTQQNLRRLGRFLGPSGLRERGRAHGEHLKMIRIEIQRFARPRQRSIILSEQVVA